MATTGPLQIGQVEAFLSVVEQGSFAGAAEGLHLSQPALSRRVAGLESAVGLRLLDRRSRCVSLTPAGQRLVTQFRRLLSEHSATLEATRRERRRTCDDEFAQRAQAMQAFEGRERGGRQAEC